MPEMAFFRPELFDLLRQLKHYNNQDWFARNKARYEKAVLDPALLFIASFGPHLHRLCPNFVADPRPAQGSLFRIYRDTRFSPDKRPFRTRVGIHLSHASDRDAHAPVHYLHLEPGDCFAAASVGDAAVMGLPEGIKILRREDSEEDSERVEYLIPGRKLRRPVKLWFDKEGGESWGSY